MIHVNFCRGFSNNFLPSVTQIRMIYTRSVLLYQKLDVFYILGSLSLQYITFHDKNCIFLHAWKYGKCPYTRNNNCRVLPLLVNSGNIILKEILCYKQLYNNNIAELNVNRIMRVSIVK